MRLFPPYIQRGHVVSRSQVCDKKKRSACTLIRFLLLFFSSSFTLISKQLCKRVQTMESNEKKKKSSMKLMNSLSRREPTMPAPDNGSCNGGGCKSIGCMTGIFQFLSGRHRSHSQKRLTSAGRRKRTITLSSNQPPPPPPTKPTQKTPTPPPPPPEKKRVETTQQLVSSEVQRSPTLSPSLRRPTSADLSLDSPRRPPTVIARLMGLEETPVSSPASAAEKRRKLLGALEKCDEDLKSLKRIIEAVRVADKSDNVEGDGDESVETVKSVDSVGEQPSPVSVLDPVFSPTCYVGEMRLEKEQQQKSQGVCIQLRAPEASHLCISGDLNESKKHDRQSHSSFFNQIIVHRLPTKPTQRQYYNLLEQFSQTKRLTEVNHHRHPSERKRSQALTESVSEIWENGVLEQTCELGKVVVIVERGIFRELVDEFVREMLGLGFKGLISQWTCRKRLCF